MTDAQRRRYQTDHGRVYRRRGKASAQTCACGSPARHWAHVHDSDPAEPANYVAMCVPCHHHYDDPDGSRHRAAQRVRAAIPVTDETRARLSVAKRGHEVSAETRARLSEAQRQAHAEGRGRWSHG